MLRYYQIYILFISQIHFQIIILFQCVFQWSFILHFIPNDTVHNNMEITKVEEQQKQRYQPSLSAKVLIFFLYMVQGFFYGLYQSIPFSYQKIPNYRVLSMFSLSSIPFSVKFLIAPFEQKFTFRKYGKRKTWIIGGLTACSIVLFLMSDVIGIYKYQTQTAVLLFLCILFTATKDVALDGLAIELIRDSVLIGQLEFISVSIGKFTTLTLFLALISKDYWTSYGIAQPLLHPSTFIFGILSVLIISIPCIHFGFKQIADENSEAEQKLSFWQILKYLKHFIDPKYRFFRQTSVFLFYYFGLTFFTDTYDVQLVKRNISRQSLMFFQNICIFPTLACTLLIRKYLKVITKHKFQEYFYLLRLSLAIIYFVCHFETPWIVQSTYLLLVTTIHCQYFISMSILTDLAVGQFSGMSITIMLSAMNLGRTSFFQQYLISIFGYQKCCIFGFIIAAIVYSYMSKISSWIQKGQPPQKLKNQ